MMRASRSLLPTVIVAAMLVAVAAYRQVQAQEKSAAQAAIANESTGQEASWPRTIAGDGYEILVYQPQVDRWEGDRIEGRAALSIAKEAMPQPTLGMIWLSARTSIDRENGVVSLDGLWCG